LAAVQVERNIAQNRRRRLAVAEGPKQVTGLQRYLDGRHINPQQIPNPKSNPTAEDQLSQLYHVLRLIGWRRFCEALLIRRCQSTSTIALMTPVSALVYDGKCSIISANGVRCVIHGRVSIRPSSIRPMMRWKSSGKALREANTVISRRCTSGSG